jgi:hypothetical protein
MEQAVLAVVIDDTEASNYAATGDAMGTTPTIPSFTSLALHGRR